MKTPVPCISCIGTSRDGKSTFMNLLCDYVLNKTDEVNKPYEPFKSIESDDMVTNGIDYYHIKNKCLLINGLSRSTIG